MDGTVSEKPAPGTPATVGASASDAPVAVRPVEFLAGAGLLLALLGFLFWDFFRRQIEWAVEEQADWGHTLVVPAIAGYFVWLRRDDLRRTGFRTTWLGFVPMIVGVGWYHLCVFGPQVLAHHNLRAVGVWLTIAGLLLLFCGFAAMRWFWFPLAYLFAFGQTISERLLQLVTHRLQDWTAWGAHLMLMLGGVDADREGNTLTVFRDGIPHPLNVAEACSGMRMLMAFLALGTALAYTGLKRPWQRVLLVALGVPIAIFVNMLRVLTLGLLSMVDSDLAAGDFHSMIGLVWLVPAFLLFLGVMWIIRHLVVEPEGA